MDKIDENIVKVECSDCFATGVKQLDPHMIREGIAYVCNKCGGNGWIKKDVSTISHRSVNITFTGQAQLSARIRRIFWKVGDLTHYYKDTEVPLDDPFNVGKKKPLFIKFSQYGCSPEAWAKGEMPIWVQDYYCPYRAIGIQKPDHAGHPLFLECCQANLEKVDMVSMKCADWTSKMMTCWPRLYELIDPHHHLKR
ncbi:MAG: hypothetical protein LBI42_14525 [Chitinispirillales bacterium]|jgi:hypothetical protein|nr:hypothetical protein [Chitinispirillales bacterium]